MTTIYLVKGSTGDYEDTYNWVAKAFTNKQKAEDFCKQLNDIAQRSHVGNFGSTYNSRDYNKVYDVQEEVAEELNKIDPKASVHGSGTSYNIEELEVELG